MLMLMKVSTGHLKPQKFKFKVGQNMLVNYKVKNLSNYYSGTATFNVLPEKVGPYFIKTQNVFVLKNRH